MGSVIDYIECPNCGHEAFSDFYYKTGEEYLNCNNCGYHYSATYKRDDEGNFITEDGTDDYDFDNLIMETKELKNPYGAYRIKQYKSIGYQCGSLENEEQLNELKLQCEKDPTVEYLQISQFINGKIIVDIIVDNGPEFDGAGFSAEDRVMESDDLPF